MADEARELELVYAGQVNETFTASRSANVIVVESGKPGRAPRVRRHAYDDEESARAALETLVSSRVAQGFVPRGAPPKERDDADLTADLAREALATLRGAPFPDERVFWQESLPSRLAELDAPMDRGLAEFMALAHALIALVPDAPPLLVETLDQGAIALTAGNESHELRWVEPDFPLEYARTAVTYVLPEGWELYWTKDEERGHGIVALTRAEARANAERVSAYRVP